ncbi:uncharacterized protein TrAtP1_012529 [Trichoderma atroviride]|uniref:uncharacterized protein n=1 Tax=Hypocrea atroviridis TaxID=63577 RepID=UPI00332FD668|nr:hypothetical protein TrAtP1_012529 [Trichoderma atroviride]
MADTSSHLSTRSTTRCPIPPSLTEQMSLTNWISIGGQTGTKAKLWATAGYRSELLDKTWLLVGLQRDSHYCYYQFGILVRVCPGKHNAYRNEYSSNATYLITNFDALRVISACIAYGGLAHAVKRLGLTKSRRRGIDMLRLSVYTCAWGKTTAASILKRKAHVKWYRMRQWPDTPRFSYLSLDSGESVSFQKRTAYDVIPTLEPIRSMYSKLAVSTTALVNMISCFYCAVPARRWSFSVWSTVRSEKKIIVGKKTNLVAVNALIAMHGQANATARRSPLLMLEYT